MASFAGYDLSFAFTKDLSNVQISLSICNAFSSSSIRFFDIEVFFNLESSISKGETYILFLFFSLNSKCSTVEILSSLKFLNSMGFFRNFHETFSSSGLNKNNNLLILISVFVPLDVCEIVRIGIITV